MRLFLSKELLSECAHVSNAPILKWEEIGSEKPQAGHEIINDALAKALESKKEFTQEEFNNFQVSVLTESSYIKVGGSEEAAAAELLEEEEKEQAAARSKEGGKC